jgi:hypothetical protein
MHFHPLFAGIETGRSVANQSSNELGLLGLNVAYGDIGLSLQKVTQRIGCDNLNFDARFLFAQLSHQRRQKWLRLLEQ